MSSSIIILGSSPNALVAAGYLAHEGHRVTVVEPDGRLGGPVESSLFAPGFRGEQGLLSLRLDPTVTRELELKIDSTVTHHKVGLAPNGNWVRVFYDRLEGSVTQRDEQRWPAFVRLLDQAGKLLHSSCLRHRNPLDQQALVEPWRALGERDSRETLRLPWMSLKDLLEEWFESDLLRGTLAFIGLRGVCQGPFASGTAFGLVQQWATGQALERHTSESGVEGIVGQMVEQLRSRGVEFLSSCPVESVALEGDVAVGLRLQVGDALGADQILCDHDAAYTFSHWISPRLLETSFLQGLGKVRYNGCVARLNLGVAKLPDVAGLGPDDWRAGVILTKGLWATEKSYDPTKYGGFSPKPPAEIILTQIERPTLSVWGQYYPYKGLADTREQLKGYLLQRFPDLGVEAEQELLPSDLEQRFRLTEGHLGGGELNINQALFLRPSPEYVAGRFPVENLYLCGATIHPGGHTGLAGRLAAHECLKNVAFD